MIKSNDNIVVNIKGTNFFPGDERIVILGGLQSMATKEETKMYFNENLEIEKIVEDEASDIENFSNENSSEISDVENDNYLNL